MPDLDAMLSELRAIDDPLTRIRAADEMDAALSRARSVSAQIKAEAIAALRADGIGYGRIARLLGISKGRVQQLAGRADHA